MIARDEEMHRPTGSSNDGEGKGLRTSPWRRRHCPDWVYCLLAGKGEETVKLLDIAVGSAPLFPVLRRWVAGRDAAAWIQGDVNDIPLGQCIGGSSQWIVVSG